MSSSSFTGIYLPSYPRIVFVGGFYLVGGLEHFFIIYIYIGNNKPT
jgi:hypothetical protein